MGENTLKELASAALFEYSVMQAVKSSYSGGLGWEVDKEFISGFPQSGVPKNIKIVDVGRILSHYIFFSA